MGKTVVCGAEPQVDIENKNNSLSGEVLNEGDVISIDGTSGDVLLCEAPVAPSLVSRYFEEGLAAVECFDDQSRFDQLVKHADEVAKLKVRANADTEADANRAN